MVKQIVKGKKIFARKAQPATESDRQVVTDFLRFAQKARGAGWSAKCNTLQSGGGYIGHLIVYSVLIKERKGAEVQ